MESLVDEGSLARHFAVVERYRAETDRLDRATLLLEQALKGLCGGRRVISYTPTPVGFNMEEKHSA